MATSGTYTDSNNNLAIVSSALRTIGRLGDFETLLDTDARYTKALPKFKALCKHMAATHGMPLWAVDEVEIPMSSYTTVAGITIGLSGATVTQVAPLKVIQCLRRDTTNDLDYPMEVYTAADYNMLTEKGSPGAPLFFTYYPKGPADVTKGTLKCWPMPDSYWQANGAFYLRYVRPFQDVGASTDTLDFPQEWQMAVIYMLAVALAPDYGVDMSQRNQLKADAKDFILQAESFSTEEGSLYLQPRVKQ